MSKPEINPVKRNQAPSNDPRWPKLEKVWKEEGMPVGLLAKRFGIGVAVITRHLIGKYGSSKSPAYRGREGML